MLYACVGSYAKSPYYIEELGIHIYSMEELCYYLSANAFRLDDSIMNEELCSFVEKELKLKDLGRQLLALCKAGGSLAAFVSMILEVADYCSREKRKELEQILRQNAEMSALERKKVRGDFFLTNGKYVLAVEEYLRALGSADDAEIEMKARIYHNMGTAYARMFLYENAATAYLKSYDLYADSETYECYLASLRMGGSREKYLDIVLKLNLDQEAVAAVEGKIGELVEEGKKQPEHQKFLQALKAKEDGNIAGFYDQLASLINEWKLEYRRNMEKDQ